MRVEDTNTAGQEGGAGMVEQVSAAQWTAGLMISLLPPEGAWSELAQPGSRAALLLMAEYGPLGQWLLRSTAWPPNPEQNPVSVNRC